jgi:hypothetical protein
MTFSVQYTLIKETIIAVFDETSVISMDSPNNGNLRNVVGISIIYPAYKSRESVTERALTDRSVWQVQKYVYRHTHRHTDIIASI